MEEARLKRPLLRDTNPSKAQYQCLTQDCMGLSPRYGYIDSYPVWMNTNSLFSGFYGMFG